MDNKILTPFTEICALVFILIVLPIIMAVIITNTCTLKNINMI